MASKLLLINFLLIQTSSSFKLPYAFTNSHSNISIGCRTQLTQYLNDFNETKEWALKMFDAQGGIPTGILEGMHVNLGNFDECLNVNEVVGDDKMAGKYCLGRYDTDSLPELRQKFSNITNFVTLGTCFPSVCSSYEIEQVYNDVGIHVSINESSCQTKETDPSVGVFAVTTIIFLIILILIITVSTIYDVYFNKCELNSIWSTFSLRVNGKCLFNTTSINHGGQITCLYGIRVLSIMWIILYHTVILRLNYNARKFGQEINEHTLFYIVSSRATLSVDTFLLMGGLLVSLNELEAISKKKEFNILRHYIGRYIRLTPVLMVLVLIHTSLGSLLGSGPLWYTVDQENTCKSYWWSAVLHLQNYINPDKICIMGSWYVSLDLQLFLFSPILLILLRRNPKLAMILTTTLAICSIALAFSTSYIFSINEFEDYHIHFYKPTHTRAAPWLIGIIVGYLIFKAKRNPPTLNKLMSYLFWAMSIIIKAVCIYIGPEIKYTTEEYLLSNSLRMAFVHPFWSMAVAWLIYASCINAGSIVNRFLSLSVFEVFSRLTFSVYLSHTNMILLRVMAAKTIETFSITEAILQFSGFLVVAIVAGVVLTLSVEMPIITLEKLYWKRNQKQNSEL